MVTTSIANKQITFLGDIFYFNHTWVQIHYFLLLWSGKLTSSVGYFLICNLMNWFTVNIKKRSVTMSWTCHKDQWTSASRREILTIKLESWVKLVTKQTSYWTKLLHLCLTSQWLAKKEISLFASTTILQDAFGFFNPLIVLLGFTDLSHNSWLFSRASLFKWS